MLGFLHKAWLLFTFSDSGRYSTFAGMRSGDIWPIESPPKLFGKDEWTLGGGEVVSSREIHKMLDRFDFGY